MTGALPAIGGYRYQVRVTVWVALDLMLRQRLCDRVLIEPEDKEDIEAVLRSPLNADRAQARATGPLSRGNLHVQVKARTEPWSTNDFAKLVVGKSATEQADPRIRRPPLELLTDPLARYLLVTSSQATGEHLDTFRVTEIGALPVAPSLPAAVEKAARDLALDTAALAPRLSLWDMRLEDWIVDRCRELLTRYGHVPSTQVDKCLSYLEDRVWSRLNAVSPAGWTLQEIEQIIVDPAIGGRLKAPVQLEGFVPPTSIVSMRDRLERLHAVFLVGQSGLGKTLCADQLIDELRQEKDPFELKRDVAWAEVDELLASPGRHLFYFEDPWGKYEQRPNRSGWSGDLLARLRHAGPDKKFLWTSAWALYHGMVSESEQKKLERYSVEIRESDYPADVRWKIVQNRLRDRSEWRMTWLESHRTALVERYGNPMLLTEFVDQFEQRAGDEKGTLFAKLAESTELEKISERLAQEIIPQGESIVLGALVIWTLLSDAGKVAEDTARELSGVLRRAAPTCSPNSIALLRWLKARRSLTILPDGASRAHPRIQQGLEIAWQATEHTDVVEEAKIAMTEGLLREGRVKAAVRVLKLHGGRSLRISTEAKQSINQWLEQELLSADLANFNVALHDFLELSTSDGLIKSVSTAFFNYDEPHWGFRDWVIPNWSNEQWEEVSQSPEARHIIERFIAWEMGSEGDTWVMYRSFPGFVSRLKWKLPDAFLKGFERTLSTTGSATDALALGALQAGVPLDTILQLCTDKLHALDAHWSKNVSEGDWGEYVLAPQTEEYLSERASEEYEPVRSALKVAVRWMREKSNWTLILTHPLKRWLIPHWIKDVNDHPQTASPEELRTLLGVVSSHRERDNVWRAISAAKPVNMLEEWFIQLADVRASDLPGLLRAAREAWGYAVVAQRLLEAFPSFPHSRQVEVLGAIVPEAFDEKFQQHLASHVGGGQPLMVALEAIDDEDDAELKLSVAALEATALDWLETAAGSEHYLLASAILIILARAGRPVVKYISALLRVAEEEVRARALFALALSNEPDAHSALHQGLRDSHYRCRRAAVVGLASRATAGDWREIVHLAKDPSAPVRVAVAEVIGRAGWLGGVNALVQLLDDQWDCADYTDPDTEPDFTVRRTAAIALVNFPWDAAPIESLVAVITAGLTTPDLPHGHALILLVISEMRGTSLPSEVEPAWLEHHPWKALRESLRTQDEARTAESIKTLVVQPAVRDWLENLQVLGHTGLVLATLLHRLFDGILDSLTGYVSRSQEQPLELLTMAYLLRRPNY